jgi:uncharacterized protein YbbC (DUF1343 family)
MKKQVLIFAFLLCFTAVFPDNGVKLGADRMDILLPMLKNRRVALVVNQTSRLSNGVHLPDTLLAAGIAVTKIFAPEHGFRGDAEAGETVSDGKDRKTGIDIISLYGRNKKPSKAQLADVDAVVFDIQDVGARFYTYISTMHYVMEACAENGKRCIVLDRPNPNDHIDGPVLEPAYKSFAGMHPVPVLHGATVGELARMINGEGWLKNRIKCRLTIVPLLGWKHRQPYLLPVKPSPNLPNAQSVKLYPSLCFFEATEISVGRGTGFPFQVIGFPDTVFGSFTFTPDGTAAGLLQKGKLCYGIDLRTVETDGSLTLKYLIDFFRKSGKSAVFFKSPEFMDKLAGTNTLRQQLLKGADEQAIRSSWQEKLNSYKAIRKRYLLYADKD